VLFRNSCLLYFVFFTLVLLNSEGSSAEEVIGVGSLTPRPLVELGSTVTVMNRQDIENRGAVFVSDLLRGIPGVSVNRTGSYGSITQVRIRGAEANHTLVIIDGVEMNDFADNDEYDFGNLLADDVERIEVLRGPQSALYGSEAIGGVVNIVTRKSPPGFLGNISAEAGSHGMRRAHVLLGGGTEKARLTGAVSFLDTHGISWSPEGGERDGNRNHTYNVNGIWDPVDALSIGGNVRYSREGLEKDGQVFNYPSRSTDGLVVNTSDESDNEQFSGRIFAKYSILDGRWSHQIDLSKLDTRRDQRKNGLLQSENRGDNRKYRYQTTLNFSALALNHSATGVFEYGEERFNSRPFTTSLSGSGQKRKLRQHSWTGEWRSSWEERLFLSGSLRKEENELFDDSTTYRITGSWLLPNMATRLRGSFGEGVKNPGVYELFGYFPGFFSGNPNLKPEQSKGWDIGMEHEFLNGRLLFEGTYFYSELDDEIDGLFYDSGLLTYTARNLDGQSDRKGLEAVLRYEPYSGVLLTASYTYLDSEDPDGEREKRRPEHSGSINASLKFLDERANINIGILYNGETDDNEFVVGTPETVVELNAYTLVQLRASYRIADSWELFARVENLLNSNYHEVEGYETPGFGAFAGLRFHFGP